MGGVREWFALQKLRERQDSEWDKIFLILCLPGDLYTDYIKNLYSSAIR